MSEISTIGSLLRRTTLDDVRSAAAASVSAAEPGVDLRLGRFVQVVAPPAEQSSLYSIVDGGIVVGAVGATMRTGGGIARIGYVLHPGAERHELAAQAMNALVDHLVDQRAIHRVDAGLAPDDISGMRVLEAIGMTCEVVARQARSVGGAREDELRYVMTADELAAWRDRPRGAPEAVELVEITADDVWDWSSLRTPHSEQRFVDPMAITFMEALFPEEFEGVDAVPWMRGVLADGEPVAFVMTSETHGQQDGHYLWRMLVDRMHQRRGIGRRALLIVIDHLREHGVPRLFTSCGQGVGTPQPFYESLGFRPTGRLLDDEIELVLDL